MSDPARILVVDDEPALLRSTARAFASAGYAVFQAETGEEALRRAAEVRPDLILIDAALSDASGIEICRRIKGDPTLAATYVVLLSATVSTAMDRSVQLEGGPDGYISRSRSNRQLLEHVATLLRLRAAEIRLSEQQRRYRQLFDGAPVMVVVTRSDGGVPTVTDCNRLFLATLGYTRDEVIERPLADFYTADSRAAMLEGGYQRGLAGTFEAQERHLLARDGCVVKTLHTAAPDYASDGHVCGTLGMFQEIDARSRAEEGAREREERYRRLFEDAPILYAVTRQDAGSATVTDCNRRFHSTLGYTREEVLGRPLADFYTPESREAMTTRGGYQRALEGVFEPEERELVTRDGAVITTLLTSMPETDAEGNTCGAHAMYLDVSARKQAEHALRESEERYRRLAENAPDLIYRFRLVPERGFEYVSPAAIPITGYTPEEHYADPDLRAKLVHPEDRHLFEGRAAHGARFGEPIELRWQRKDGRTVWIEQINVPVYDSSDTLVAFEGIARDVTARKEAEEALQRSREVLKTVFDVLPVGVWIQDRQGGIEYGNAVAHAIWGIAYSPSTALPERPRGWWADSGRSVAIHEWAGERAVESGQAYLNQMIDVECFDGSHKTLLNSAMPMRDAEQQITGAVIVNQDITPLRQAETELRRRNRELALLNRIIGASVSESSPEALLETACCELAQALDLPLVVAFLLEENGTDFRAVAEWCAPDQPSAFGIVFPLAGHPILQHMSTSAREIVFEDALADPQLTPFLTELRTHNVRSAMILPLLVDGQVVGSLDLAAREPSRFSADDVHLARIAAQQAGVALARVRLEQADRRLNTAIEQAAESVVITDTSWNILYVNPAFERVTGYSRSEALGHTPDMLRSGAHDAGFYRILETTVSSGQVWRGRLVNKAKDGSPFTEDATIAPVRDESGTIVNFVAVKRDITHELQLEEQFLRAQRMEAVGRLTAGIAHDFNNLLTAINGFAELLQMSFASDHPAYELSGKILHGGRRAADLVGQLLAFSRKQMTQPQVLHLNDVVTNMNKMLQRIIGEDVQLVTSLGSDLWQVKADRAQIEQIIVNLAVNARDAMPNGGSLFIETSNVALDETYVAGHLGAQVGEYVQLAISDTGLGMSQEVQARIFEPFFTTKGVGEGTGLGLATVYGIVKQNAGDIWVYSEEGHGTTFKVYLPRVASVRVPLARPAALAEIPTGTETILVAEDNAEVREMVRRVLRGQGYRVLEARNGAEALQVVADASSPIHLLLTDVVMPEVGGSVLADQLMALRPGIKVLYMTGYAGHTVAHLGEQDAGMAILEKPFGPPALARKVRAVLDSGS
jgi:two-component system cell cycle sensor histidine kinase/response regulator CckA